MFKYHKIALEIVSCLLATLIQVHRSCPRRLWM